MFGSGVHIDDCSVHLERNMKHKFHGAGKKKKKQMMMKKKQMHDDHESDDESDDAGGSLWDTFRNDFNRIKGLPTLALVVLACHLFVLKWGDVADAKQAVLYFETFCFVFRWTRAQVGAGNGSDNNPLEGTNRATKESQHWQRKKLSRFGPDLLARTREQSCNDYGFNKTYNPRIWCNATFNLVESWASENYISCAVPICIRGERVGFALPSAKLTARIAQYPRDRRSATLEDEASAFVDVILASTLTGDTTATSTSTGASLDVLHDTLKVQFADVPANKQLDHLFTFVESFHFLQPAQYNDTLTDTLWSMLGTDEHKRGESELMCCSCGDYMHYLCCAHVIAWHMHKGQVHRPGALKQIKRVAAGKKARGGSVRGALPLSLATKIPRGAALSKEY